MPAPASITDVAFDRWREVGADGVVLGAVSRTDKGVEVQVRLFSVRRRQQVFGKSYSGSAGNPRLYAHTISDEIHQQQRALKGVARTRLTFASDRDGERVKGPADVDRSLKEIYLCDYDGENSQRVTVNRALNNFPVWSGNGRDPNVAIAYTSWRHNNEMQIFLSYIYQGLLKTPTVGHGQNWLAAWSPDGTKMAFTSNRDGNPEIYVMDADGGNVRRITSHPANDTTPTWSPSGTQIAFTYNRTGTPQIYIINADGTGLRPITHESYCDRPTWSPAPYNEIAYASQAGPGYDIRIFDFATGQTRSLTNGEGTNESPAFSPNGRHVAFVSTRKGKQQIFTMDRDGRNVRQITTTGYNYAPNWSR